MEQATEAPRRAHWYMSPFYRMLMDSFPTYRTPRGVLDVDSLAQDFGRSYEVVYRWLRNSKVTNTEARKLVDLAGRDPNRAELVRAGREPPEMKDFLDFM